MTVSNKNFIKFTIAFSLILFLGLVSVLVIGSESFSKWVDKIKSGDTKTELVGFYKENSLGGKTPYEAFDFFLAALESGDVYKASEYFISETKGDWKDKFEEIKITGGLEAQVNQWKRIRQTFEEVRDNQSDWDKRATSKYSIIVEEGFDLVLKGEDGEDKKIFIEPGEYDSNILFSREAVNNLWKIISL